MIRREGERVLLDGPIVLAQATRWREEGAAQIDRDGVEFDLAAVTEVDSSAVSLMMEWQRIARSRGHSIKFVNLPPGIRSLAAVYGVTELIPGA